jgi:hypothetical protein
MKLSQMPRLLAAAFALVTLVSGEAYAQAEFTPILAVSATGNSVEIRWTPIAIAPSYELVAGSAAGAADIAAVALPAAQLGAAPRIVVTAPNGGYFLRVRGAAGAIKGPWSNEVFVGVGFTPCVPGVVPTLSVSVENSTANLNWTPVPGAVNYRVEWSRFAGATELAEPVTGTSASKTLPLNGTFYVRVVAITNDCGLATSNEAPFTISVVKRHLSTGEILSHLNAVAAEFPRAWQHSARDHDPERLDFIILAARRLYSVSGGTVGGNFRRAIVGDLSADGISVENPADNRYYFADVIHCSGWVSGAPCSPAITYSAPFHSGALLRNAGGNYAPWGFADPFGVSGSHAPIRTHFNYGPAGGW